MYKAVIASKILRCQKKMLAGRTFQENDKSRKILEEDMKIVQLPKPQGFIAVNIQTSRYKSVYHMFFCPFLYTMLYTPL